MRILRLELIEPGKLDLPSQAPEGVTVSGNLKSSGIVTRADHPSLKLALDVVIEVGEGVSKGLVVAWLLDLVKQYKAKRIRINRREPANEAELESIISEELEIGKND